MSLSLKLLIIICLLIIFVFAGCKAIFSDRKPPEKIKIADKTQLNENWVEITPSPPLTAIAKIHFIGLKLKNVKGWADESERKILFNDGRVINIEVELIDENDRSTFLFPNGFAELVEFGKRVENKKNTDESFFRKGEKFNKIRLRSDKPIEAEEIVWMEFEY
jgi:hypothetical protein